MEPRLVSLGCSLLQLKPHLRLAHGWRDRRHSTMPFADQTRPDSLTNANEGRSGTVTPTVAPSDVLLSQTWGVYLVVILFAAVVYLGTIVSPPSLQDDVDAVQAQIARN